MDARGAAGAGLSPRIAGARVIKAAIAAVLTAIGAVYAANADPLIWLPPARYRHAYPGKTVETVTSWQRSAALCRAMGFPGATACAWTQNGECHIVRYAFSDVPWEHIPPGEVERLRVHEVAHCLGWAADHPGAVVD